MISSSWRRFWNDFDGIIPSRCQCGTLRSWKCYYLYYYYTKARIELKKVRRLRLDFIGCYASKDVFLQKKMVVTVKKKLHLQCRPNKSCSLGHTMLLTLIKMSSDALATKLFFGNHNSLTASLVFLVSFANSWIFSELRPGRCKVQGEGLG